MKTSLLFLLIFTFLSGKADIGQDLFKSTCAACHSIGKGRLVGPDLANVNDKRSQEWLVSFIRSSSGMVKNGDTEAVAVFEEYNKLLMPDNNFTDTQILSILNYINSGDSGDTDTGSAPVADLLIGTTDKNISNGAALFSGDKRFENKGSACNSCHKVRDERIFSSGTLAKDLSETHEIMGTAGIAAILRNPPFPVMLSAYKNFQLTEEEVIDLTAYLKSVSEERIYQRPTDFSISFALLGIFVFIMIFMTTIILYFKRKKLAVNHRILGRPSKVVN